MSLRIDLFCRVIDNYGDIAVCWRLARLLTNEHRASVRLIVDDLKTFARIDARVKPQKQTQTLDNIDILSWSEPTLAQNYTEPGDVVIEAFACTLPDFIGPLLQRKKPVWVDYEYLTAEGWIETCHAKPSIHPQTGLAKTLFFPGFTDRSGGLLREEGLVAERARFQADLRTQNDWRKSIGLPEKTSGQLDASIFCYPDAPVESLRGLRLFIPEGLHPDLEGEQVYRFPFLSSHDYDRLLWTCDLNFVRGEDSWVRAVWAGKPFIWQIYKQDKNAHLAKLQAFLSLYTRGFPSNCSETLAQMHVMWNEGGRKVKTVGFDEPPLRTFLTELADHALSWSDTLARKEDGASRLIGFVRAQMDPKP